jgi:hypothetical protein
VEVVQQLRKSVRSAITDAPDYSRGSTALNRAGLQVVRICARRAQRALRRPRDHDELREAERALEVDGYCLFPNYLRDEDFARLLRAVDVVFAHEEARTPPERVGDLRRRRVHLHKLDLPEAAEVLDIVDADRTLDRLAENVMRRPPRRHREWKLQDLHIPEGGEHEGDKQLLLHADRHFMTLKGFLVLEDEDEHNGPFRFSPRSHRLSLERLRHEREMSIGAARARAGEPGITDRPVLTPEEVATLGEPEIPLYAKANTLVVANTAGLHARAQIQPGHRRRRLWRCYHDSEMSSARRTADTLLRSALKAVS